jgi:archaellum component FlaF (FlaF/FlaG flagellin family)
MAIAVVAIICIAMIVVGGMTLSQGILTSADVAAVNFEKISALEGEITRTDLTILRAAKLSWSDYLRVTVENSGQTKLADFDMWDVIVNYEDDSGGLYSTWLPYTTSAPAGNEWQKARIGLNGPVEFFEPGILNPLEEMVGLIHLNPASGNGTSGSVSIAAPNGVYTSFSFFNLGYTRLTAQSENITLANTKYYELAEAAPADGPAITVDASFIKNEIARKLLYNGTRPAKFIYPLIGISRIPSANWTVNYRVFLSDGFLTAAGDRFYLNIDIKVIKKDGTVRDNINVVPAAEVYLDRDQLDSWITVSGNYIFSTYNVVDENDYLEIDFYGETKDKVNAGYVLLSIDDNNLPIADQTRIEA